MPIPNDYNIPVSTSSGDDFELLPEDTYQVEITKLELRTDQPVYQSDAVEDKFSFEFTITEDGGYKGRKLWLDVRTIMSAGFSGGSPSWLYRIFCAVNGVNLGEDEVGSVNATSINEMEGKQLRLVVKQKLNGKGVLKNKIIDVMALKGKPTEAITTDPATIPDPTIIADVNVDDIPF